MRPIRAGSTLPAASDTWYLRTGTRRALRESGVRSDSNDSEKMIETMGKMMEQMMDYHD